MRQFFQVLNPDLKIVGDTERIDAWIKPNVPVGDSRVWGFKYYARRAGLVLHTSRDLGNEMFDYEFVESMFNRGEMVDARYVLYASPAYHAIPLSDLDVLLPVRDVRPELGRAYVHPPLT